jgi:hypothetical protein
MTFRKLIMSAVVALTALYLPLARAEDAVDPAKAMQNSAERLQIADPYIELHTGPGRGFPVFFVAQRGEWIGIDLRYTDWYKVRTEEGKIGWVHRNQLLTTLTTAGEKKTFRDILVDDYLNRHLQLGAAWGRFDSDPMLKIWMSYRLSDTLSVEGTLGQMQGTYAGADFWHINLVTEPWSDRRISPFFSVGMGKFKNYPNQSLVNATTTVSKLANASIGARYYLSERFIVRADYTIYTAFVTDNRSLESRAFTAGLAFFF